MIKSGDTICIKDPDEIEVGLGIRNFFVNEYNKGYLILNHKYIVLDVLDSSYGYYIHSSVSIINSVGEPVTYPTQFFKELGEYRNEQIKKILKKV